MRGSSARASWLPAPGKHRPRGKASQQCPVCSPPPWWHRRGHAAKTPATTTAKGNHFSRPHFHPNDRYIVVLQGTWWVGSGPKFDPANTTSMPPGSFVTHFGKQVHWDGAKDEDTVLLIMGEGPATSTAAEEK